MLSLARYRQEWFGTWRADLLSGLVVALALIPEAIAFSLIAGVDPKVGLYASFSIALLTAIVGGRPGMISAATAATAVLMVSLVKDHGLQYLLAASVLAGVLQIGMGLLRLGFVMRYVSKSVMTGFVNALAILIFLAQLPELDPARVPLVTYALVALGMAVIYLAPRVTRAVPAPLIAIVVVSLLVLVFQLDVRTVGDMGALPDTLPVFLLPQVPFNLQTLAIIFPYALAVAVVGLLESLMTQSLIDEATQTRTSRDQECIGQGTANLVTGFFGGMAGCAMIGQSMINIGAGGRGRLSCATAGVMLLVFCVALGDWVSLIPMPALVAVMLVVTIGTFSWRSILDVPRMPLGSSVVMLATVAVVLWTHNLALGVLLGVILSGLFFAARIARHMRVSHRDEPLTRVYQIEGQLFYGAVETFLAGFDLQGLPEHAVIDLSRAQVWDVSGVQALQSIASRLSAKGAQVSLQGMNGPSLKMVQSYAPDLIVKG